MPSIDRCFLQSYVHSIKHVGLALDFGQKKISAEGFTQAAVHMTIGIRNSSVKLKMTPKERHPRPCRSVKHLTIVVPTPVISTCSSVNFHRQVEGEGKNRRLVMRREMIKDDVCRRVFDELAVVIARYCVDQNDEESGTAELINATACMAASAQFLPHECRIDFYLMHRTDYSIWHTVLLH